MQSERYEGPAVSVIYQFRGEAILKPVQTLQALKRPTMNAKSGLVTAALTGAVMLDAVNVFEEVWHNMLTCQDMSYMILHNLICSSDFSYKGRVIIHVCLVLL